MFTIQVFNHIAKCGLDQLPKELYDVSANAQQPHAVLLRSQNLHDWQMPGTVQAIGRAGAGVNNIPVAALTKMGIPVFNTPGANANAVCELVLSGMLIASRHLCDAWHYVRGLKGDDKELNTLIEEHKKQFIGSELLGKTLGIVGLGSIGVRVANAAIHLGMRVIGYDPTISVNRAWELSSNVIKANHLAELFSSSDYISLHVPLLAETKNMVNASVLAACKPSGILLNFARDGIVDNQALIAALQANRLASYVTDFPAANLKDLPNVIAFPHLGASTTEAEDNCAVMIAKQIRDYLEYGIIRNSVNFPNVEAPAQFAGQRLAIVNENVPNMVAQISSTLAEAGLNINSLINQSRDEIAYNLLDVEGGVNDKILEKLRDIHGVLQVRMPGVS